MAGTPAIAEFIAPAAFVVLIIWGWVSRQMGPRAVAVFVALAALAWLGLPRGPNGENFVTLALVLLDVALVLVVFVGDARLG